MPTETDFKLADRIDQVASSLSEFRIEAAGKFGAIETELRIIRKLAAWLLGGVFGLVAALLTGAATVAWSASSVVSDVKHQAQRIDKLEGRMDGIDAKLDTLIRRGEPKTKGQ